MIDREGISLLGAIEALGDAIAAKDWSSARRIWERLTPFHAQLLEHNPNTKYLADVLRNQEAMVAMAERLSASVH